MIGGNPEPKADARRALVLVCLEPESSLKPWTKVYSRTVGGGENIALRGRELEQEGRQVGGSDPPFEPQCL